MQAQAAKAEAETAAARAEVTYLRLIVQRLSADGKIAATDAATLRDWWAKYVSGLPDPAQSAD